MVLNTPLLDTEIYKVVGRDSSAFYTGSFIYRSSHQRYSIKGALKNFVKFKGKRLRQSLFFNIVGGLRPATLLKKRLLHWFFPVNFTNFRSRSH